MKLQRHMETALILVGWAAKALAFVTCVFGFLIGVFFFWQWMSPGIDGFFLAIMTYALVFVAGLLAASSSR